MELNPIIEIRKINKREYLHFTFKGKLTTESAQLAINEWKEQMLKTEQKCSLVWNCLEMTGYEPMARSVWQNGMKELKGKINKIWLISNSPLIIAGARIMSIFTSFDFCTVKSESEIIESNSGLSDPFLKLDVHI